MDEGNPAAVGDAFATPARAWLTPLRAALLMATAVLGGVVLSLALGSSPAHAVENPGPDIVPPAPATSATATALHGAIPGVQRLLTIGGRSLATTIPATGPVVTPVVGAVGSALTAVDQAVTPVVDGALAVAAEPASSVRHAIAAVIPVPVLIGSPSANAGSSVHAAPAGSHGSLPSPVLTSSASASAAAVCILFLTLLALALPGMRKRLRDDALPASPVFETPRPPEPRSAVMSS